MFRADDPMFRADDPLFSTMRHAARTQALVNQAAKHAARFKPVTEVTEVTGLTALTKPFVGYAAGLNAARDQAAIVNATSYTPGFKVAAELGGFTALTKPASGIAGFKAVPDLGGLTAVKDQAAILKTISYALGFKPVTQLAGLNALTKAATSLAGFKPVTEVAGLTALTKPFAGYAAGLNAARDQAAIVKATSYALGFNPATQLAGLNALTKPITGHAITVTGFSGQEWSRALIGRSTVTMDVDGVSDVAEIIKAELGSTAESSGTDSRGISRMEAAVYVAIAVFFVAYFSCSALVRYQPNARIVSGVDGPTPFEFAMFLATLAYGATMTHGRK